MPSPLPDDGDGPRLHDNHVEEVDPDSIPRWQPPAREVTARTLSSTSNARTAVPVSTFLPRVASSGGAAAHSAAPAPAFANNPSASTSATAAASRNLALHGLGGSKTSGASVASSSAGSSSGRQLPASVLAKAAPSSSSSKGSGQATVLQPRHTRVNPLQQPIAGSSSRLGMDGIPIIDGSNARIPSAALARQHTSAQAPVALPSIPRVKAETSGSSSSTKASAPADTTSAVIDLTQSDDDDEPTVVDVKKTEPDVVLDAERNQAADNQIVCLGMIRVRITVDGGRLPVHMISNDGNGCNAWDALYDSDNWPAIGSLPRGSAFWTEPGYRPVHIQVIDQPLREVLTGRYINGVWESQKQRMPNPIAMVRVLLSPAHVHHIHNAQAGMPTPQTSLSGPDVGEAFGQLYERDAMLLADLHQHGPCGVESRIKIVSRAQALSPFQSVEVNVFVPRARAQFVIMKFRAAGHQFERPSLYDPTDYPNHPPLLKDHLTTLNLTPSVYTPQLASGSSVTYTAAEAQEEARKQVDQVYSALKAGEDLPMTEPGKLLKTRLFPHQKQALSFLLDREKERSWEQESSSGTSSGDDEKDEKSDSDSSGDSNRKRTTLGKDRQSRKRFVLLDDDDDRTKAVGTTASTSKAKDTAKADKDGSSEKKKEGKKGPRVVSLWRADKDPLRGTVSSWTNVVTNQRQRHRPQICRGALLADDMGLGKTISIIALMTRTLKQATEYGKTSVTTLDDVDLAPDDDDDNDDVAIDASSFGYGGMPRARGRKKNKREKKWTEQERARITNLKKRSRATLIVCPLTVVANWMEQIEEHWVSKSRPKVYLYHGPGRSQNTSFLANHDVIVTTYSTLGSEFSRSKAWDDEEDIDETLQASTSKLGGGSNGAHAEDDDDDEDFEMYDVHGQRISGGSKTKAGAKRKRAPRKEAYNPLQRIEFFRIVLDESHMIKETSTLQSKAVCNLSAQRRISLTGTPIQNKLDDLYSQFKFLRLDPFHKKNVWNKYCMHNSRISLRTRNTVGAVDSIGLARIQTLMKAVALRRTKDSKDAKGEPILKLPPKASRIVKLEFDEHERAKYEAMRHRYKEDFEQMVADDSVGKNYASILVEINALRLTCDDATLVDFGKDAKRLKEGRADLVQAIREDGLSPDRAAQLFKVFVDCDQGLCYDCERDLSGKLDVEEEELEEDVPKKRGSKKAKTNKKSTGEPDDDSRAQPVVTRCQHLFCSDCFARRLGAAWLSPKADTKAPCPQCNESLTVTLDAVELDPETIQDALNEQSRRNQGAGSDDEEEDEEDDHGVDLSDTASDDDKSEADDERAWRPTSNRGRFGRRRGLRISDEDDTPDDVAQDDVDKKVDGEEKAQGKEREDVAVRRRDGMSSKVRALLADLEPFSRCNPYSQLYDRKAPRLDHYAPPPPAKTEEPAKSEANGNAQDGNGPNPEGGSSELPTSSVAAPAAFEPVQVITLPPLSELPSEEAAEARKAPPIKSVVFSQWTRMLDRIGKALEKKKIRFVRLDGSMSRPQRARSLELFKNNPRVEVMLISLRAGGFGLNLVSACRAYLIDPYWNPAVENQGLDRIHRLGQRKPVVLTRFVMKRSIEENMLELQKRKMELAEQVGRRRGPQSAAERRSERERDLRDLLA